MLSLIFCLLALCHAASPEIIAAYKAAEPLIRHFDVKTLKPSIATGNSLIFYGAEWCGHCQRLTPIWLQLQSYIDDNHSKVIVGKVECTLNEELCGGLDGYPTIHYYVDGVFKSEHDDRDLASLIKIITTIEKSALPSSNKLAALLESIQKPTEVRNADGKNVELTESIFDLLTAGKPWFVKFYAPWCGHCKTLAPIWEELGQNLKGKINVGSVDCTVHSAICKRYAVKGYPTLLYLNEPRPSIGYDGARVLDKLEEFAVSQTSKGPFAILKASQIAETIKNSPSAIIFVYDATKDESLVDMIVAVAKAVSGKAEFYICPEQAGYDAVASPSRTVPVLVLYRDNGINKNIYSGKLIDSAADKAALEAWIGANSRPYLPQLDTANQLELTKSKYLLIAVLDTTQDQKIKERLVKIAQSYREEKAQEDVGFAWLDGIKFSSYVKQVYGFDTIDYPRFVVTLPSDDLFYLNHHDAKSYVFSKTSVFQAIDEAQKGLGSPRSTKGTLGLVLHRAKMVAASAYTTVVTSTVNILMAVALVIFIIYYAFFRSSAYAKIPTSTKAD